MSSERELGSMDGAGGDDVHPFVDPLFEFDVPRLFVDPTLSHHQSTLVVAGDRSALPSHDPWFDRGHEAHSKPSYELAQEADVQQQRRKRYRRRQSSTGGGVASATATAIDVRPQPSAALNPNAALEKENQSVGPLRRAATTARPLTAARSTQLNRTRQTSSSSTGNTTATARPQARPATGAAVSGLPVRMHRRSGTGPNGNNNNNNNSNALRPLPSEVDATARSARTAMQLKATTVPMRSHVAWTSAASTRRPATTSTFHKTNTNNTREKVAATSTALPVTSSVVVHNNTHNQPTVAAAAARTNNNSSANDLVALLAKHNKKFKATHTYQPPQHSVRDVRKWERQTHQSYYDLTPTERVQANREIATLVQQTAATNGHSDRR